MKDKIIEIVAQFAGISEDDVQSKMDSSGLWDSLKRAEIIFSLEDEFDICFEPEDIEYMTSPAKIIETVQNKISD